MQRAAQAAFDDERARCLGSVKQLEMCRASVAAGPMERFITLFRTLKNVDAAWANLSEGAVPDELRVPLQDYLPGEHAGIAGARAVSEGVRAVVRTGVREAGGEVLASGLSGAVLSSSVVEVGSAVWDVVRGEIDMATFGERTARVALRGVAKGLGMQAASALGASGMVAAAIPCVTVFAAGLVLKSSMEILKQERLAADELQRVRVLCASAIALLDAEEARRAAMCEAAEAQLQHAGAALDAMDTLVRGGDPEHAVAALGYALGAMGRSLVFASQEEFDDFLDDPDAILIL